jgi:hypothetical protein
VKRRVFLLAIFFLIGSCDQPKTGADGYRFEKMDFERSQLSVTLVPYPSAKALQAAGKRFGVERAESLAAFATLSRSEPRCTIHYVHPQVSYEPEWLGHELVHCIYGQFHGDGK